MSGLREEDGGDQGGLREDLSSSGGLRADGQASEPARAKGPSAATFGFVAPQLQEAEAAMRAGAPMTARLLDLDLKELVAGRVDAAAVHASVRALVKKKQELEGRGQNFAHLKSLPKAYPEFNKWLEQIAASARKEAAACSEQVRSMALAEVRRKLTDRAREYYENDLHEGKDKKIDGHEYALLVREARGFLFPEAIAGEVLLACRAVVGDAGWQPPSQVDGDAVEKEKSEAKAHAEREAARRLEAEQRLAAAEQHAREAEQRALEAVRGAAAERDARNAAARDAAARDAAAQAALFAAQRAAASELYARDAAARAAAEQQARAAMALPSPTGPPPPAPHVPHVQVPARTTAGRVGWNTAGVVGMLVMGAFLVLVVLRAIAPKATYCAITDQTEPGHKCTGKIYDDTGETVTLRVTRAATFRIHAQAPSTVKIPLQPVLNVTDGTGRKLVTDDHDDAEVQLEPGNYKINISDAYKGDPSHFKGGFSFELEVSQVARSAVDLLHYSGAEIAVSSTINNSTNHPDHLIDGKEQTAWNSRSGDLIGSWIAFRLPTDAQISRIEMSAGFNEVSGRYGDLFTGNHRITRVRVLRGGVPLGEFSLSPEIRTPQAIPIEGPGGEYKIQVVKLVQGTKPGWREVTVSELRVIGAPGRNMRAGQGGPHVGVGGFSGEGPPPPSNTGGSPESGRAYVTLTCGAIQDTTRNLEWYLGPDRDTSWDEAATFVRDLRQCGGGWRMPTNADVAALYDPRQTAGTGYEADGKRYPAKISPAFGGIGGGAWVWSAAATDPTHAVAYNLFANTPVTLEKSGTTAEGRMAAVRAFAVRSATNMGTPGSVVELAPDDVGFADRRGGWGWGDRCWLHIKSGRLGWAKAACNKATEMNPASPDPRASILYNHGLIEEKLGHRDAASAFYKESLSIRPNATVQSALDRVDRLDPQ